MSPQMGRPKIDNPKEVVIRCRITKDFNDKIEKYCNENNITKTELIISGISNIINKNEE